MGKARVTTCLDRDLVDALDYARGHRISRSSFLNMLLAAFFKSGMAVDELFYSTGEHPDRYAIEKVRKWKRGDTSEL